ncbi:hypothetical protein NP233_g7282 [Leucocoprinus birnbaumii]|uniref:Polysaccharide biosynthesis domain-containing protein n=1 Tax=Leucocoprinus birnbaumii TaxID=56174 RepID=A0AAD5YQ50_9AGAR|nr:hypothetical protein NP233_g7282 [Leucocoprinus birnbaumii]
MDQKRAQTLEALEAFIQSQKALLDTTYSDIERLKAARAAAIADPKTFVDNLHTNLDAPSFRLSALPDWQVVIPKGIDWSVFEGHDPAPLQKFTLDAQQSYVSRNQPHSTQKSPLSDLQKLVKTARRSIIDPVLAAFSHMSDLEDETESEMDEEEAHRQREREKIRLLKQRKIRTCGLKLPGLRMEGSSAVFVRHDVEDETMDVDISLDQDDPLSSISTPQPAPPLNHAPSKISRSRRPSTKKQNAAADPLSNPRPSKKARKDDNITKPPPPPDRSQLQQPSTEPSPKQDKDTGKPKPETYKQAWSVSEQHLLEQLLEQIPDGEKYRTQHTPFVHPTLLHSIANMALAQPQPQQRFDPNKAQNLLEIEKQFAVKAVEQAQTYWNLLEKVNPRELRLTKLDDEIYEHTMKTFPELAEEPYDKLIKLDEDWMKSEDGKKRWRVFIEEYKEKVKDYNFGSLIRTDAREEYGETNTIFVTRIQFYAIEISRNRLGLNDKAHEIAKAEAEKERLQKEKEAEKEKNKKRK